MKLLLTFLFISTFAYSQKTTFIIIKKDGTEIKAKNYSNNLKFLKITHFDKRKTKLNYSQLDKIIRVDDGRKGIEKTTYQFVRVSKRNGFLMSRIVEGKCNVYANISASGGGSSTTYFAKRKNEQIATRIGSKDFMVVYNYKKVALEYFKDCTTLIARIKKKFKRKKIVELVEFYNKNCK
tara:strand:+ start:534 stop:1073 length:540 start_codon:yes stop_codon:yes gene_type:complete